MVFGITALFGVVWVLCSGVIVFYAYDTVKTTFTIGSMNTYHGDITSYVDWDMVSNTTNPCNNYYKYCCSGRQRLRRSTAKPLLFAMEKVDNMIRAGSPEGVTPGFKFMLDWVLAPTNNYSYATNMIYHSCLNDQTLKSEEFDDSFLDIKFFKELTFLDLFDSLKGGVYSYKKRFNHLAMISLGKVILPFHISLKVDRSTSVNFFQIDVNDVFFDLFEYARLMRNVDLSKHNERREYYAFIISLNSHDSESGQNQCINLSELSSFITSERDDIDFMFFFKEYLSSSFSLNQQNQEINIDPNQYYNYNVILKDMKICSKNLHRIGIILNSLLNLEPLEFSEIMKMSVIRTIIKIRWMKDWNGCMGFTKGLLPNDYCNSLLPRVKSSEKLHKKLKLLNSEIKPLMIDYFKQVYLQNTDIHEDCMNVDVVWKRLEEFR